MGGGWGRTHVVAVVVLAALVGSSTEVAARAPASPGAASTLAAEAVPPIESPAVVTEPVTPTGDWSEPVTTAAPTGVVVPMPAPVGEVSGFDAARSVEVVGERTATSQMWSNPDGTHSLAVHSEARFFQPPGSTDWEPIDPTVVADPARPGWLRNTANAWTVRFGPLLADGSGGVEVTAGSGAVLRFTPADAASGIAPEPGTGDDADTVVYRGVWPGVDLRYTVTASGVKEDIVLNRRQDRYQFAFDLYGPALGPDPSLAGGLATAETTDALDVRGNPTPVFRIGAAEVLDKAGRPVAEKDAKPRVDTAAAPQEAVARGAAQRVSVAVDRDWLADRRAAEFPLIVDPLVTPGVAYSESYKTPLFSPTNYTCYGCGIRTGDSRDGNYPTFWRTVAKFNYDGITIRPTHVWGADVQLTCGACSSVVSGVSVHWANAYSHDGAANPPLRAWNLIGGSGDVWLDVTDLYQYLSDIRNPYAALGFTGEEGANQYTYKRFDWATLWIDYNQLPVGTNVSPSSGSSTHSLTPTVSARLDEADPDQGSLWYRFEYCETLDGANCSTADNDFGQGGPVAPGTTVSATIPANLALQANKAYLWRIVGADGRDEGLGPWQLLYTTNTAPSVPGQGSPAVDGVTTGARPAFTIGTPATDPEGDAIQYRFKVTTGSDGQSGRVLDSGYLPVGTTSWSPPAGGLPDGTYYWTVQARDAQQGVSAWATPRKFRHDLRLGVRPTLPYDAMGPMSVNLGSGNAVVTYSGPSFATVGGPMGVSFTYNSLAPVEHGLTGSYYADPDGDAMKDPDEPRVLRRVDPQVTFDWGAPGDGPDPGVLDPAHFTAEWDGYLTVPAAGNYTFLADGGPTNWTNIRIDGSGAPYQASGFGTQTTAPIPVSGTVPVHFSYGAKGGTTRLHLKVRDPGGNEFPIPADWLTPTTPALPHGWARSGDALGAAYYTSLKAINGQTTQLIDDSGATHTFGWTGSGWQAPPDEDGVLTQRADGTWQLSADDGYLYDFDVDGRLTSVTTSSDALHPGAITYQYNPAYTDGPRRMTQLRDATGRTIDLTYGTPTTQTDPCPTAAGFTRAPAGMLCKATYTSFEGDTTDLYYSNGQLARILEAGTTATGRPTTDFGYDTAGRLVSVRDAATNDLIAAGQLDDYDPEAETHKLLVTYDPAGRVTKLEGPIPSATGARAERRFEYEAAATQVQVGGFTPDVGYARRVELDTAGHAVRDLDATGVAVDHTWDQLNDRVTRTVDHHHVANPTAGLVTTTLYDAAGRVTDQYGPGDPAEFDPAGRSTTAPHTTTAYDEGITGLAAAWYPNPDLAGAAALHTTSPATHTWGTGAPSSTTFPGATVPSNEFSGRLTGEITVPTDGTITVDADGGRVTVDDRTVIDTWGGPYRATVLADGPLGYWRLGDAPGAPAASAVGAYPGTYTGTVTRGVSSSLTADGDPSVTLTGASGVVVPHHTAFDLADMTIEARVKPTTTGVFHMIANKMATTGSWADAYELRIQPDGFLQFVQNTPGTGWDVITSPGTVPTGTWSHVAATRSGNTVKLYINGNLATTGTVGGPPTPTTEPVRIGHRADGYGFTGGLDEVAIYPDALAAARIAAHATAAAATGSVASSAAGYANTVRADRPKAWWRLGGTSGAPDAQGDYGATAVYGTPTYNSAGALTADSDTAMGFNGNEGAELPVDMIRPSTFGTVEAWFKTTSAGAIVGMNNDALTEWVPVVYVGTDGRLRGKVWDGSGDPITTPGVVNDGQWHHVALTYAGVTQALYLDGTWVGQRLAPVTHLAMNRTRIGSSHAAGWPASNGGWFNFVGTIDDVAIYDTPLPASRVAAHVAAGRGAGSGLITAGTHRISVEYQELIGDAYLNLTYTPTTGTGTATLKPRYNLPTSTVDADGKRTATEYANPELGLATATVEDPAGLNLRTTSGYETSGAGRYFRRTSRTLPAGNTWTYQYYGTDTAATADNPCTTQTEDFHQGGALWKRTSPDPDGAGPQTARVEQTVHDLQGRVVATWIGTEPPTCTTYDDRGRVTTVDHPAYGGEPARPVTYNHYLHQAPSPVPRPQVSSITDPAGTIIAEVDWAGRVISYTDVWGKVTTTSYDPAGRVTDTTGPGGAVHTDYDGRNRPSAIKLDGNVVATPGYDPGSGLQTSVSYGNGTSGTVTRDARGRLAGLDWRQPGGALLTSDTVTRTLGGDVIDQSIDGTDPRPAGPNYVYDTAGRLTDAWVPGHTLTYAFAPTGGCGVATAAGKNTNRTSSTDNGATTSYCYDHADRLTSTTAPGYSGLTYDSRGNTTNLGGETHGYDAADRHLETTAADTTVRYKRDATDRIVERTATAPGVITPRGSPTSTGLTAAGTSITLTAPTTRQDGDLLVAHMSVRGGTGTTITAPAGWTQVTNTTNGTELRAAVYTRRWQTGDPTSYAFTLSTSQQAAGGISAYAGVDASTPVDVSAASASAGTTTSPTAPSLTTVTAETRLLTLFGTTTDTAVTAGPTGMSVLWSAASSANASSSRARSSTYDQALTAAGATGTRTATTASAVTAVSTSLALRPAEVTTTVKYSSSATGDSPDATLDVNKNVVERTLSLPGGALLTTRTSGDVWSYPNSHGDIVATASSSGAKQGPTLSYDPYGTALDGTPDNSTDNLDYTWLGQHQRPLEHQPGLLPIVEMGARQYDPTLGRFLETDPVEGGSCNDYDYVCGDTINAFDLDGEICFSCAAKSVTKTVRKVARKAVKVAKRVAPMAGIVGFGVCIAASAGACAVAGAIGVGLSATANLGGCAVSGCSRRQWLGAAGRTALDYGLNRLGGRGVRAPIRFGGRSVEFATAISSPYMRNAALGEGVWRGLRQGGALLGGLL